MKTKTLKKNKVNVITLGCSKNLFDSEESVDFIVTEYGIASLQGLTIRERAQSLIDISHPGDRQKLLNEAKKHNIIYQDQIFIPGSSFLYPDHIEEKHTFKSNTNVRFRPIKPSDEEFMRRFFYRFSKGT